MESQRALQRMCEASAGWQGRIARKVLAACEQLLSSFLLSCYEKCWRCKFGNSFFFTRTHLKTDVVIKSRHNSLESHQGEKASEENRDSLSVSLPVSRYGRPAASKCGGFLRDVGHDSSLTQQGM